MPFGGQPSMRSLSFPYAMAPKIRQEAVPAPTLINRNLLRIRFGGNGTGAVCLSGQITNTSHKMTTSDNTIRSNETKACESCGKLMYKYSYAGHEYAICAECAAKIKDPVDETLAALGINIKNA